MPSIKPVEVVKSGMPSIKPVEVVKSGMPSIKPVEVVKPHQKPVVEVSFPDNADEPDESNNKDVPTKGGGGNKKKPSPSKKTRHTYSSSEEPIATVVTAPVLVPTAKQIESTTIVTSKPSLTITSGYNK